MFNNEILNTLVKLQKQGVDIHMTDDGWVAFFFLMRNEEVVIEAELRGLEDQGIAVG